MKLNKEDFLNSELGSNLLECIESWDWALRGGVKTKPLADWCQAQWEVYQIMFRQIFHINYHFTRTDERFGIISAELSSWATRIYMINTAQPDRPCKITWSGETTTYDQNN